MHRLIPNCLNIYTSDSKLCVLQDSFAVKILDSEYMYHGPNIVINDNKDFPWRVQHNVSIKTLKYKGFRQNDIDIFFPNYFIFYIKDFKYEQ